MVVEQIKKDAQTALKARDALRLSVLRNAISEFTNELVAQKRKPTDTLADEDALKVLKRLSKQRKDSAEQFEKGNRAELAEKEKQELTIIEEYLPQQAGDEEIEKVTKQKMEEMGIADKSGMGQLMGAVMKELGGNADGTKVKEVVERELD